MKFKEAFVNFVSGLEESDLEGMARSKLSIGYSSDEFYVGDASTIRRDGGDVVYDSEGEADHEITVERLRERLIGDAEVLTEGIRHAD